jgi:ATP synthase protein I
VPNLGAWEALGVVTQFGITCAVAVGLGYFVGSWIDGRLGTGILFSLILALGGMISAVTGTYQMLKLLARRQNRQQHQ